MQSETVAEPDELGRSSSEATSHEHGSTAPTYHHHDDWSVRMELRRPPDGEFDRIVHAAGGVATGSRIPPDGWRSHRAYGSGPIAKGRAAVLLGVALLTAAFWVGVVEAVLAVTG